LIPEHFDQINLLIFNFNFCYYLHNLMVYILRNSLVKAPGISNQLLIYFH
jgi:hypothetical protein